MLKSFTNSLVVIIAGVLAVACTPATNNNIKLQVNPLEHSKYKRIVQFVTSNNALAAELKKQAQNTKNIITTNIDDFSEFRIVLDITHLKTTKQLKKPQLFGKLEKRTKPSKVAINYTITNQSSHVIAKGQVHSKNNIREVMFPKFAVTPPLTPEALRDVATQLINTLVTQISTTPWSTTIVGQIDSKHFTVGAGKEVGLHESLLFITETLPKSTLQIVTFEDSLNGLSRAVMKVIKGEPPTVGRKLIPLKK